MAELKIAGPPSAAPPKVNVNLRGDLNPNEVGDIAAERGIVTQNSPFPDVLGPQGNAGLTANDNTINQGVIEGQTNQSQAKYKDAKGQPVQPMTPTTNNQPGEQLMSAPGSGATPNTPQGNIQQQQQRRGK